MQDLEITQGKEGNAGVCFFPLPLSCCCRRFLPNNSFIALKERYHSQRICGFKQILKKFTSCLQTTQLYLANALMILVGSLLTMKGLFYVIIIKIFRICGVGPIIHCIWCWCWCWWWKTEHRVISWRVWVGFTCCLQCRNENAHNIFDIFIEISIIILLVIWVSSFTSVIYSFE